MQRVPLATLGLSAAAAAAASDESQDAARKKRGRPAKPAAKADAGRVERVMLWRFLLNLLEDPHNESGIHWVNRDQGIFRILNTDWLARLWGRRHGNPRMTYEKMARAMRTYYRSKVLQPVPRSPNLPRKLVYKFNPAVVQRVAAANKLAQQQQQQLQQQRYRQPRHGLQYEADQQRQLVTEPQPQAQLEDRSQQLLLLGHEQRRQLPQHEHYYLSEQRQHHQQLHQSKDRNEPLEDGRRWEPHPQELQRKQVFHLPVHHRLPPDDEHDNQRLHQHHHPQLQLHKVRHHSDEQEQHLRIAQNYAAEEARQQSRHHSQQAQQLHQNTDEHHTQLLKDSQQQQAHHQHQRPFGENNHHQTTQSHSGQGHLPSPKEQHGLEVMQRVPHSPNDSHPKTKISHQQQLDQAHHQREINCSPPEMANHHNRQQQEVPNDRDSSTTTRFQQT